MPATTPAPVAPATRRPFRRLVSAALAGSALVAVAAPIAGAVTPHSCLPHCPPVTGSAYGQVLWQSGSWVLTDTYNSRGLPNSLQHPETGRFLIAMPGLTAGGGTANVSAYAPNCTIASWATDGTNGSALDVRCWDASGAPADGSFSWNFTTQRTATWPYGYAWVDNAASASSTPYLAYQYSDEGGTITVKHPSTGTYNVSFPNSGYGAGGTAKATAVGSSDWCETASLNGTTSTEKVKVKCFAVDGTPADTQFTITFMRETDQLDQGLPSAYAAVIPPSSNGTFAPYGNYSSWASNGKAMSVYKVTPGYYDVTFTGYGTFGNVQISTWSTGKVKCRLGTAYANGSDTHAVVFCAPLAHPTKYVDTPFMVQLVN
jgi:hypothetical protein